MTERQDPKTLGELLGLLAHDLRNPLSALHSNLGFLKSLSLAVDVDAKEAIEDGMVSCDGLSHIIDNIDLLGQTLRSVDRPEGSVVDLSLVVSDVVAGVRSMAQSHAVLLEVSPSASVGATAYGSREFITRALSNLVRNSIQHSAPGSKVLLSLRAEGEQFIITVQDSGTPLTGAAAEGAFTAQGQVGAKSIPHGRYSRGLGLYAAALAATAGRAEVRIAPPPSGAKHAFELVAVRRP